MSIPILAADPSLTATGYAITTDKGIRHGVLKPGHRDDPKRMLTIAGQLRHLAQRHDARIVALEGVSMNSKSSSTDRIAGLHWTIRAALWGAHIPYIVIPPATVKQYAVGYGLAPKRTSHDHRGVLRIGMLDAARDHLDYRGHDDNEADALWLLALLADSLGQGYAPDLGDPKAREARRRAIATVVPLLPREGVLTGGADRV